MDKKAASSKRQVAGVKALEKKIAALTEDLKRSHADFINYRRRNEEEQSQIMTLAKKEVVLQFLPVLDNVQRALGHLPKDSEQDALAQGYKMLGTQLQSTFQQLGVAEIPALGAEFDPHLHEAVDYQDGQGDSEVVTEVLKAGYQLGELVLRPSVVRVGKGGRNARQ